MLLVSGIAFARLKHEITLWRKDHPVGCSARPYVDDMFIWDLCVVGLEKTDRSVGRFDVRMEFTAEYPIIPPKCSYLNDCLILYLIFSCFLILFCICFGRLLYSSSVSSQCLV